MAQALRLPRMSDTMEEGVIASLKIKKGDKIKAGDVIAEVETDKATMEWESFVSGTVLHISAKDGDAIKVNGIVAVIGNEGEDVQAVLNEADKVVATEPKATAAEPAKTAVAVTSNASSPSAASTERVKASPLAKKIAAENGLDIKALSGSGDEGRIVRKDVEAILKSGPTTKSAVPLSAPVWTASGQEGYTEVNVSQMRKTIARRLSESKFSAPEFYLTIEVNMDQAVKAREQMNLISPVKISFNDFVIKAAALALKKHPGVNASWLGDKIRYNQHVHIGMAVAVEDGLVVPVLRHADQKPLSVLSQEAKFFGQKAKDKKIVPEDMAGNTFSISNLGMFGIDEFTAIINPPDACILAVGGIKQCPAVVNGEIKIANLLKMTLTCDHRVVDGAGGAAFLQSMKGFLENPVTMLV